MEEALIILFLTMFVLLVMVQQLLASDSRLGNTDYGIEQQNISLQGGVVEKQDRTTIKSRATRDVSERLDGAITTVPSVECLDKERKFPLRSGDGELTTVCSDIRCIDDANYFEIQDITNTIDFGGSLPLIPSILKRCDPTTLKLVYDQHRHPDYIYIKEYTFTSPSVYIEVVLPSYFYTRVWDGEINRWYAKLVRPTSVNDLPREHTTNGKLRVSCDDYTRILDFCRFSIHAHINSPDVICCERLCSRPEPLTAMELSDIRRVAKREPYYTCSWLEKHTLFKWHVGEEKFEPYWQFERAVGVYCDIINRLDHTTIKLFLFKNWKSPDVGVTNADTVYFKSPINLGGYKWYEPSAIDEENQERYESKGTLANLNDEATLRVSSGVMNLSILPHAFIISSHLVEPTSFDQGSAYFQVQTW